MRVCVCVREAGQSFDTVAALVDWRVAVDADRGVVIGAVRANVVADSVVEIAAVAGRAVILAWALARGAPWVARLA